MQSRYDTAEIKADLTYNNEGRVLSWLETDIVDNTKYIMYVVSNGKTYLTTGTGLFAPFNANLERIELNNVDTSRVTSMATMFYNCSKLTNIDLSGLGSDSLTNISSMFRGCSNLTSINMNDFNFGSASMCRLFESLPVLENVNLSNANTSLVTDMSFMFTGSFYIKNIDLSGLGSDGLTTVGGMFQGCNKLTTINMSNFNFGHVVIQDTSSSPFANNLYIQSVNLNNANMNNVTKLGSLFSGCESLISVDMSGVNTSNVIDMSSMFLSCLNLTTIYVNNTWNVSNVTSSTSMFSGCESLKGGGTPQTVFDSTHTDKEYARIDGGANSATPGYLTLKTN